MGASVVWSPSPAFQSDFLQSWRVAWVRAAVPRQEVEPGSERRGLGRAPSPHHSPPHSMQRLLGEGMVPGAAGQAGAWELSQEVSYSTRLGQYWTPCGPLQLNRTEELWL